MIHWHNWTINLHQPFSFFHDNVKMMTLINVIDWKSKIFQIFSMFAKLCILMVPLLHTINWTLHFRQLMCCSHDTFEGMNSTDIIERTNELSSNFRLLSFNKITRVSMSRGLSIEFPLIHHCWILQIFDFSVDTLDRCCRSSELGVMGDIHDRELLFSWNSIGYWLLSTFNNIELMSCLNSNSKSWTL